MATRKLSPLIDITGKTFNCWTVIKRVEDPYNHEAAWLCRCICGTERNILGSRIRSNKSRACSKKCRPAPPIDWQQIEMKLLGTPESRKAKFGGTHGDL